jgi:hypothetical protein
VGSVGHFRKKKSVMRMCEYSSLVEVEAEIELDEVTRKLMSSKGNQLVCNGVGEVVKFFQ